MAPNNNHQSSSLEKRARNLDKINRRSTREEVLNVFAPNEVVMTPAKFAGRHQPLEHMIDALLAKGASLVVFGERGCGKSSLAYMMHSIARGDLEILDYYGLREHLEKKGFLSWLIGPSRKKFNVIWVNGFAKTHDEMIRSILTRRREGIYGPGLLAYLEKEADQIEISSKIGFDKVFTAGGEYKEVHIAEKPLNIKEGFEIAMQRYADQHTDELLIIIDEFETVKDKSEISQYVKSVRPARFVLVGIAATILELIGEHASVARDIHGIELAPMNDAELRLILEIGSYILSPYCSYAEAAMDEIVRHCYGSPYWCHFLARALLQQKLETVGSFERFMDIGAYANGSRQVEHDEVTALLAALPQRADCRIYEEALEQITVEDETTARVLLGIAIQPKSIISSASVAKWLEQEQAISKDIVMTTINTILQMPAGPLEERVRIRDIVSFSFRDPNFKRYILIRNAGL